jgi:NAD(P)-dependent dehydrogenase (short-subunit alcohol dehydrogenase family)
MTAREPLGGAVVTGATRGIGLACAVRLAADGYGVVIADVDDAGEQVAAELMSETGGRVSFAHTDVTSRASLSATMADAEERYGRLEVLVNNAAVTRVIDFFSMTPDEWDRIMTVNARGCFFAMQEAAGRMRSSGGGRIVNVASIAGKGFRDTTNIAYASSKGAIITMTRIAAALLGPYDIRVNSVCPGMTKTAMWTDWIAGRARQEGVAEDALIAEQSARVPLGRLSEPDDIANAVAFLASRQSHTITGQSINVDGGVIWD